MSRMTRGKVKQEHSQGADRHSSPMTLRPSSGPEIISSSSTPAPGSPHASSGTTTIPDTAMAGMHTGASRSNGEMPEDVLVQIGSSSKDLIQAIQNLKVLGLQTTLPSTPIPSFVVVGDQSAGKSSVVEAICDITLPRSESTTTRCPFSITTSAASDASHGWKCTVSLEHDYNYNPLATGPNVKFQQWDPREMADVHVFAVLHDKSELEATLKRAQMAILSPRQNPRNFVNAPLHPSQPPQVPFSPNVVSLKVESAGLPELSFYDLPGLISYHENQNGDTNGEDQYVVEFVEELAKHYINDKDALILFACSATQDVETSLALRLIKRAKAANRSTGVITKPDLVPLADFETSPVQAILRKEKIRLGKGWFVTRQLSRAEVESGMTYEQARERERAFFDQQPWNKSPFTQQFGVPALQLHISGELRDHIVQRIPTIRHGVHEKLASITHELSAFPEQDEHPVATVAAEIQQIATTVQQELGGRGKPAFRTDYKQAFTNFDEALKNHGPDIVLDTPLGVVVSLDTDDEDQATDPSPIQTPTARRFATPSKRALSNRPQSQLLSSSKRAKLEPGTSRLLPRPRYTLDFVREEHRVGCASGIPDMRQPEVTDRLSLAAIKTWNPLVASLLDEVEIVVQRFLADRISTLLAARLQTQLYKAVSQVTNNLVTETLRKQSTSISLMLASEQHVTLSSDNIEHLREEMKMKLHSFRLRCRIREVILSKEKGLDKKELRTQVNAKMSDTKWQAANLTKDVWHKEVDDFIVPLSYYQLARRRFQENVGLCLEFGFLHQICCTLAPTLRTELGTNDVDRCRELIAEHADRERTRQDLVAEQRKLEAAIAELSALTDVEMDDA